MMVVLLVSYPRSGDFEGWCRSLVERRLAACINVVQTESIYWWDNKVNVDSEVLLVIKTSRQKSQLLKETIVAEHPYKVPEMVEITPTDVYKTYLDWVVEATTP
ncbi:MAG: divalent-cation tolerance protein CutA [Candidatus Caldarchaeum sp.]